MNNYSQLQIRILDTHCVLLGIEDHWIRLGLPWIARDIAELITQMDDEEASASDILQRLPVVRMVLTQLQVAQTRPHSTVGTSTAQTGHSRRPEDFYRQTARVSIGDGWSIDQDIIIVCEPSDLLALEEKLISRSANAWMSVMVYSDKAVMVGPILQTQDYCAICYRYLTALPFGLCSKNTEEAAALLAAGTHLGGVVARQSGDTLIFDTHSIEIKPFLPFIACPHCHFSRKDSIC